MAEQSGDGRRPGEGQPLEALLRQFLAGGRPDPRTERYAAEGLDRLRTFLAGQAPDRTAPGTSADVPVDVPAEVVEEADVLDGTGVQRHVVRLAGGRRAELVLPERLSSADAERIAALLAALALDEDDE